VHELDKSMELDEDAELDEAVEVDNDAELDRPMELDEAIELVESIRLDETVELDETAELDKDTELDDGVGFDTVDRLDETEALAEMDELVTLDKDGATILVDKMKNTGEVMNEEGDAELDCEIGVAIEDVLLKEAELDITLEEVAEYFARSVSWKRFIRFVPPQYWVALPLQTMLQRLISGLLLDCRAAPLMIVSPHLH
jgi:hypothetical protein